jgi:soluble lytic murein transglycosylase
MPAPALILWFALFISLSVSLSISAWAAEPEIPAAMPDEVTTPEPALLPPPRPWTPGDDLWPTQVSDLAIDESRLAARARYVQALGAYQRGDIGEYRAVYGTLDDYPLHPYLRYQEYRARLSALTPSQVNDFIKAHPDFPPAERLQEAWLRGLGTSGQWQALLDNFPDRPIVDVEIECLRLRALLATAKRDEALDAVEPLWVVAQSQPKVCDPLFESWLASPRRTQAVAWRRLNLAVDANQRQLARYLQRFFDGEYRTWATTLYDVHVTPTRVLDRTRFAPDNELSRTVIAHGLRRLSASDAEAAIAAFAGYRTSHAFEPATAHELDQFLIIANARQGRYPVGSPAELDSATLSGIADAAVKQSNWREARAWIERMPDDERGRDQWQYWHARATDELDGPGEASSGRYAATARDRSYYGFLAAERGNHPTVLNGVLADIDSAAMRQFRKRPDVARTEELIALGDRLNVRREWLGMTSRLTSEEGVLLAYLLGAHEQAPLAISTANLFELRDHVAIRFPVMYREAFESAAAVTKVPVARLMSLARQESAFDAPAISSANARGLIQMLHSTAVLAARRAGLPEPSLDDLADAPTNIRLASRHVAWLLERYDGVFPLAAAAYNAGEHRVDRWIRGMRGMPMDVWIETIPFSETRNYVKNVLAFNQVYGMLLDEPVPILEDNELTVP